jgi:hypothetical protein
MMGKKSLFIVLVVLVLAIPAVFLCMQLVPGKAEQRGLADEKEVVTPEKTVTTEMTFRVFDGSTPIPGVFVLLIGQDGEIVDTLTTDEYGEAIKPVTAPIDPKYFRQDSDDLSPRGTVTLLALKEGYRETVLFEVPVSAGSAAQPFYMEPLVSGERNEPVASLGNNHRLEVISLVNKYAER